MIVKMVLPKQHGAWAMLLIPYILGISASTFHLIHIPLFIGWFFLYLATYPLIMVVKGKKMSFYIKWALGYLAVSFVFLAVVLGYDWKMVFFGLAMIPFFLFNIYFVKKKNERALANDLFAICVFCIGGLASFYVSTGSLTVEGWNIALLSFLYFAGSTFFIKSMIREKKNTTFKWWSWGYHAFVILLLVFWKESWLWTLPYVPSLIRAISLHGKKLSIMKLGIIEIVNSAMFLLLITILL